MVDNHALRVLVIDNYDSFTYNLVQYLGELGADPIVFRNDVIGMEEAVNLGVDRMVISPGPGRPEHAGVTVDLIRALGPTVPTLGVCLGHQAIATACGGSIVAASELVHGKASEIDHDGKGVFADLPSPFSAGRYHSLVVDATTLPDELEVTARTTDGVTIMGLRHRIWPVHGVQFHPESVLTDIGHRLLQNFLAHVF